MRRSSLFLSLLTVLIISVSTTKAQTSQEAVAYMSELSAPFSEIKDETWKYLKAVTRGKGARKVENKRQDLLSQLKASKSEVAKKGSFHGNSNLKSAMVSYLDISYKVLNEDFDKIMDMEDIAEQSYDLMEAYLLAKEKASETLDKASDDFNVAYNSFAKEYNVNIVEGEDDKKSEKIKKASSALNYYNDYYLIFFKSYKQEAYALDALNRGDINSLEQNVSTLKDFSISGIEEARVSESFHGDNSLKYATQNILAFYKSEAEKDFQTIIDFYIKKDNYEKVKKMVESKGKKDRTQQDLDQYNKSVKEYNESIASYNKAIESMNKTREQKFEEWQKKIESFFDEHS